MKLHHHAASSLVFSGILYFVFKSWSITLTCFLAGILIDVDHIFDYVRNVRVRYKVLHSWEILLLTGIIAWYSQWNPWIMGIVIGFAHHVVLDKVNNGKRLRNYSFFWRWNRNAKLKTVFRSNVTKRMRN